MRLWGSRGGETWRGDLSHFLLHLLFHFIFMTPLTVRSKANEMLFNSSPLVKGQSDPKETSNSLRHWHMDWLMCQLPTRWVRDSLPQVTHTLCTLTCVRPKNGWKREYGSSKLEVEINGTIYISTAARKNEGGKEGRREGTRGMANITWVPHCFTTSARDGGCRARKCIEYVAVEKRDSVHHWGRLGVLINDSDYYVNLGR